MVFNYDVGKNDRCPARAEDREADRYENYRCALYAVAVHRDFGLLCSVTGDRWIAMVKAALRSGPEAPSPLDENATAPLRALSRAFSVLDCFTPEQPSLPLRQIAEKTRLSDATTLRMVRSLVELGYLVRDQAQQYSLSLKILHLANCVKATLEMRDTARGTMNDIVRETGETAVLLMRDGNQRVVIDYITPSNTILGMVRVGDRLPLPIGAASRLLLAYAPADEQASIIDELDDSQEHIREDIDRILASGFSMSESENIPGTFAIAAPIFEANGTVGHALSLCGPIDSFLSRQDKLVVAVMAAAKAISFRNGYTRNTRNS